MLKKITSLGYRFVAIVMALVTLMTLGIITQPVKASAASLSTGGQAYAGGSSITVYTSEALSTTKGTIYATEGFTVLESNTTNYRVQYSTSSGTKEGYISKSGVISSELLTSCVGYMTGNAYVYYGENFSTYPSVGSVYSGEYVSVLAKNGNRAYIEYNTSSGRKRGYISTSNLTCYNESKLSTKYRYDSNVYGNQMNYGSNNVYAGPSFTYPRIGSIGNENVTILAAWEWGSREIVFIEYNISNNQKKTGYVIFD